VNINNRLKITHNAIKQNNDQLRLPLPAGLHGPCLPYNILRPKMKYRRMQKAPAFPGG